MIGTVSLAMIDVRMLWCHLTPPKMALLISCLDFLLQVTVPSPVNQTCDITQKMLGYRQILFPSIWSNHILIAFLVKCIYYNLMALDMLSFILCHWQNSCFSNSMRLPVMIHLAPFPWAIMFLLLTASLFSSQDLLSWQERKTLLEGRP